MAGRVRFPGWVAPGEVHALLAGAAVVPIPSLHEGFGLVALEAGLAARPVVASRVEGIPEVVIDGETGLLVPPRDASALAASIVEVLGDPAFAADLSEAGRVRATAFDWSVVVPRLEHVYGEARVTGAPLR